MPEINFFWDPLSDNILQERDETGAVTAEYTTEPGLYGNLISQNQSGVESQHHFDALGSTLALTDDDQQVTDTNAYTAFGEVTERSGSTTSPFQFLGKRGIYSDSHVNECYTRRSSYQPSIARVLSSGLSLRMTRPLPSVSLQAAYFPSPYGHLFSYALFGLAASGDGDSNESGQPPGGKATGGNVCAFVAWFAPLKDRDKGEDLHRFGICQAKCVAEKANRKFTVVSVQEVLDLITNSKCCTLYACCHQGGD
jgi:hypothetical protein